MSKQLNAQYSITILSSENLWKLHPFIFNICMHTTELGQMYTIFTWHSKGLNKNKNLNFREQYIYIGIS